MTTLTYAIDIAASVETVWKIMLDKPTYQIRTKPFSPASTYTGSREAGADITFIDEDQHAGMIAVIAENILHEYISIEHHECFEQDSESGEVLKTKFELPYAYENYRFIETPEGTRLEVEQTQFPDEYKEIFDEIRPAALEELKRLCEQA